MNIKKKLLLAACGAVVVAGQLAAQTSTTTAPDFTGTYYDTVALAILFIIIMIVAGFLYFGMGEGVESPVKEKNASSLFAKIKQRITGSTPIEKEHEIMLQDDYDGIRELDNRVPPWFSWLFYVTIIFSVFYILNYHIFNEGKLQEAEYADEMKLAEQQREELVRRGAFVTEETVAFLNDAQTINNGKAIFKSNCVACHGNEAGGLVGPNLTDNYWIHGAGIKNVFKTIKYGVPVKGMISWQTQLNPKQIQDVASFILSIQGTNPPNAKAPEGAKVAEVVDSISVSM